MSHRNSRQPPFYVLRYCMKIDLSKQLNTLEQINAILNNKGIAEVKLEWNGKTKSNEITVVDIRRKLGSSEPIKE